MTPAGRAAPSRRTQSWYSRPAPGSASPVAVNTAASAVRTPTAVPPPATSPRTTVASGSASSAVRACVCCSARSVWRACWTASTLGTTAAPTAVAAIASQVVVRRGARAERAAVIGTGAPGAGVAGVAVLVVGPVAGEVAVAAGAAPDHGAARSSPARSSPAVSRPLVAGVPRRRRRALRRAGDGGEHVGAQGRRRRRGHGGAEHRGGGAQAGDLVGGRGVARDQALDRPALDVVHRVQRVGGQQVAGVVVGAHGVTTPRQSRSRMRPSRMRLLTVASGAASWSATSR